MSSEDTHFLNLIQKHLDQSISTTEQEELYHLMTEEESRIDLYLYLTKKNKFLKENDDTIESLFESSKRKYKISEITVATQKDKNITALLTKRYQSFIVPTILILLITAGITYLYQQAIAPRTIKLTSAKGERKLFRLNDGTEIWLNSDSQLEYNEEYGQSNRDVKLSGEAFFNVTKHKKLPFHVDSYGNTIEVLGTQFNVQAYPEERKMETALFEGKVNLKVNNSGIIREFIMHPGEKIEVTNIMTNAMRIKKSNIPNSTNEKQSIAVKHISTENGEQLDALWTKNRLVFQDEPLDRMVRKMQRWYNTPILIENKDILNQSYTGMFKEKTVPEVLDILIKTGANLHYKEQRDTIILY